MTDRTIASYCTTFLKVEMLHIYRQVSNLRRFKTFVLTRQRENSERYPFDDVEVLRKPGKNFLRRFYLKYIRNAPPMVYRGEYHNLLKVLKRRPVELMHIYFGHTGVHLLPFMEGWDRPCVVSFHGADVMPREEEPGYLERLRRVLEVAPLVLARSESLKERLVGLGCPVEKIQLNRAGIPMEDFPVVENREIGPEGPVLVQACRLIPKKGLPTTLRAFAKVVERFPTATLHIAGKGPMQKELESQVAQLGLGERVRFFGFLKQEELFRVYSEADLFVHPSELTADQNQEGVPNSMLEAMATGLPVAATWHGGIPEAVDHEESGLLVKEGDVAGLASAMLSLLDSRELRRNLGAAAAKKVRETFELGRQVEKLEDNYQRVIDQWRAAGRTGH